MTKTIDELKSVLEKLESTREQQSALREQFKVAPDAIPEGFASRKEAKERESYLRTYRKQLIGERRNLTQTLKENGIGCGKLSRELGVTTSLVYSWTNAQNHKPRDPNSPKKPDLKRPFTPDEHKTIDDLLDQQRKILAELKASHDSRHRNESWKTELKDKKKAAESPGERRRITAEIAAINVMLSETRLRVQEQRYERDELAAKLSDLGLGAPRQALVHDTQATNVARWISDGRAARKALSENS